MGAWGSTDGRWRRVLDKTTTAVTARSTTTTASNASAAAVLAEPGLGQKLLEVA